MADVTRVLSANLNTLESVDNIINSDPKKVTIKEAQKDAMGIVASFTQLVAKILSRTEPAHTWNADFIT